MEDDKTIEEVQLPYITELGGAILAVREIFVSLMEGGFTERQAAIMCVEMMLRNNGDNK